jgi:leucine dehydrogenase
VTLTQLLPSLDALSRIPFTHEQVLITTGPRSSLIFNVAVHSTRLGQALSGARVWQSDNWTDAVADDLRLSAAMNPEECGRRSQPGR